MRFTRVGAAACLLATSFAGGAAVARAAPGEMVVPGSVADAVTSANPAFGNVPATQTLTVQLWLRGNEAGASAYADSVSNPESADYHHYLSPNAYTAKFGASAASASAVSSWLSQQGFTNVTTDAQRSYVRATAPASTVRDAFQVRMKKFTVPGQRAPITSNDRAVTLPSSIAPDIVAVTGLNNAQPTAKPAVPKPAAAQDATDNCSSYYGQHTQTVPSLEGITSFPTFVCGYTGGQLRAGYGMNNANTGKGVTVAYVESGAPYKMFQTLTKWAASSGLPAPRSQNYSELAIGAGSSCGNRGDGEEQMDIEAGYAMAPDQHELLVSADTCELGSSYSQAMVDALNAVLGGDGNHPLATIVSNSWGLSGGPETGVPADEINALHDVLLRAVGEGVGMYFASGDNARVESPANDPYAIAVGGTTLGLDANNKRLFETGWSDDVNSINADNTYTEEGLDGAASGGASVVFNEPAYQRGVVPASMANSGGSGHAPSRVVPDVSAVASWFTGIGMSYTEPGANGGPDQYSTVFNGGTSLAAPLVAGMVAAAEQGQPASFGFLNPLLYLLAGSGALNDVLPITSATPAGYHGVYCPAWACGNNRLNTVYTFDNQNPKYTKQVTAKGYDTMTGLGTPNGQNFINALRQFR